MHSVLERVGGAGPRNAVRRFARYAALVTFVAVTPAWADGEIDVTVPDTVAIRIPTQTINFALTHEEFPPPTFPARYSATEPEDGSMRLEVYANAPGGWSLLLEIPDLFAESAAGGMVPAERLLFRIDGGDWRRGSPLPQLVHASPSPTDGWLTIEIAFELELLGSEPAGQFAVPTRFTVVADEREP